MKFYHFTRSAVLESIQKQGLIPSSRSFGFEGNVDIPTPPYFPVVWLTQVHTASGVFADVVNVVRDVRIKLALPIKSKELWHWGTWLERHDPYYLRLLNADADATLNPGWAYYWFFRGVIPPSKFRGIDANPVDARREISDERRQELLARSARNSSLVRRWARRYIKDTRRGDDKDD